MDESNQDNVTEKKTMNYYLNKYSIFQNKKKEKWNKL